MVKTVLWESPVYRFRVPVDKNDPIELKEVVLDVTGSAPPFKEPSENLKEILEDVFSPESNFGIENVLEFGAAKLKNIPYILRKGKKVCAVEFESLMENKTTQQNLQEAHQFGADFQELLFPNPFLTDEKRFDLALLANVLPVMPVPTERLYVLKTLYEKLKPRKFLLWVAQKEGTFYRRIREEGKNQLGDGVWMGKGRRVKTFYRYHPADELDEIMGLFGFELVKKYSLSDDARLYRKTEHAIMNDSLTPDLIENCIPLDLTIKDPESGVTKIVPNDGQLHIVEPNPKKLSIESLYIRMLDTKALGTGIEHAEEYHRLVSYAISRIFRGSLRNMDMKVEIDQGIKIIDTVFTNAAAEGFFHSLQGKIDASYPMVEVKNYKDDVANAEFDQLNGRLNKTRGHFGMLVCRNIKDPDAAYARCKTYLPDNYVLFLTDADLIELLKYSLNKDFEAISDYMDKKLQTLLFR